MRSIDTTELKALQMEILDYVHKFCVKNHIKYSLACGTLIGAVRHGGFIPWDDDIDIMLPRVDFEKLVAQWNNSAHPYIFHCIEKGNNFGFPYGKISNPLTIMNDAGFKNMGVNIDVFSIDGVVDMEDFNTRHQQVLDEYLEMSYVNRSLSGSLNTIIRNLIRRIQHYPNTPAKVAKKISMIAQMKNKENCQYLFEMVAGRLYKAPFLASSFDEVKLMKFEDREYNVLVGYDNYLTCMFGDYMKLPPVEKQVSHHNFEAWWKE